MQFLTSRYNADETDYGYFKFDKHANLGRLINSVDIVSQLGRGILSTVSSLGLSLGRIGMTIGGTFTVLPVMLIINGFQCSFDKEKRKIETFDTTFKVVYFFNRNFDTGFSTLGVCIPEIMLQRGACIAADLGGIICPQLGQVMRNAENNFVDQLNRNLNKDSIIFYKNYSDNKIAKFVFEQVWPRVDKYFWFESNESREYFS